MKVKCLLPLFVVPLAGCQNTTLDASSFFGDPEVRNIFFPGGRNRVTIDRLNILTLGRVVVVLEHLSRANEFLAGLLV